MFPECDNAIESSEAVTTSANNNNISKMQKSSTLSVKDFQKFGYSLIEISDQQSIPMAKLQNILDSNMKSLVQINTQCVILIV